MIDFTTLYGKTLQEVWDMLPIGSYSRIFCDVAGMYKPALHKEKWGSMPVQSACEFREDIIYISVWKDWRCV